MCLHLYCCQTGEGSIWCSANQSQQFPAFIDFCCHIPEDVTLEKENILSVLHPNPPATTVQKGRIISSDVNYMYFTLLKITFSQVTIFNSYSQTVTDIA